MNENIYCLHNALEERDGVSVFIYLYMGKKINATVSYSPTTYIINVC